MGSFNFLERNVSDTRASTGRPLVGDSPSGLFTVRSPRQVLILAIGAALVVLSFVVIIGLFFRERRAANAVSDNPASGIDQRRFESR